MITDGRWQIAGGRRWKQRVKIAGSRRQPGEGIKRYWKVAGVGG
jgi:hypothetical protein